MEKFSLWLMPAGEVSERLSAIIRHLSSRYGAPEFPPHVTLLGSFPGRSRELTEPCAMIAASLRPFVVRLGEIGCLEEYFRCLFVRAALDGPLRHAYRSACRALGDKRRKAFLPHLSLLYGIYPPSVKQQIIAEVGPRLDLQFRVRSLHLYRTQNDPPQWREVARFSLK